MPTPTAINAISKPVLGDPPDIEGLGPAFDTIDGLLVSRFATVSAMNAAILAPVPGQLAYAADTGELYVRGTASWLSAVPRVKIKSTTEIVQNNVYLSDAALFNSLEANSGYKVVFSVPFQSNTTPGFKWKFTVPTGAAGYYRAERWKQGSGALVSSQMKSWDTTGDSAEPTDGTLQYMIFEGEIYTAATAGNIQFLWAQFITNVSDTSVFFNATISTLKIK